MTLNEKLVSDMNDHDVTVAAEGLSEIVGYPVRASREDVLAVLNYLSNRFGGYGLVAVMDALRNK